MSAEASTAGDLTVVERSLARPALELASIRGHVSWELRGFDGRLKASGEDDNGVTQEGERYYWERSAGITGAPPAVTGMKLGTGTTAFAKTGAGAALVTYLANSHQAMDVGFPASSLNADVPPKRVITWKVTYAAGKATSAANITEAVIVNDALADATSPAGSTIARVLLTTPAPKAAGDSLAITWTHSLVFA